MPRSLEQWFAHQSQVHPHAIDLDLERLNELLERLQWRQPSVPVITVAGTNGKGSVTAYCSAILRAAGYRVGSFTSPHFRDYRERIRIDDRLVTNAELIAAFERIETARLQPNELLLTFFEYNALAAFLIFDSQVDVWVLEVGMGGRLDAVNVVNPTVAVVVSIGLDHQAFLGNTVAAIATEKAGIFRKHRAAVFGSTNLPGVLLELAESMGANPKRLGVHFDYTRDSSSWHYRGPRWDLPALPLPALLGATQFANAAAAIAALEELALMLPVSPAAIAQGLETVCLTGRFQVIAREPLWILDVAHNPDAAAVLAKNLADLPHSGRSWAVCGILADKDAVGIAAHLRNSFDGWWLASTEGARGSSAAELAERIRAELTVPISIAEDVAAACAGAWAVAQPQDRIIVFGSFHTVGPALDWLETRGLLPPSLVP